MTSDSSNAVRRAAYAPWWGVFFMVAAPLFILYGFWLVSMSDSEHDSIGDYAMAQYRAADSSNHELRWFWLQEATRDGSRNGTTRELEPTSFERSVKELRRRQQVLWLSAVSAVLFLLGRRLRTRPASLALKHDPRQPVLFLRPFSVDDPSTLAKKLKAREHGLLSALTDVGPVIAIGRPGDVLPAIGAIRVYVSHDRWKDTVHTLLEHARFVVMQIGASHGVLWELGRIRDLVQPERVALFFDSPGPSAEMRATVAKSLRIPALPSGGAPFLVTFDRGWHPLILERQRKRILFFIPDPEPANEWLGKLPRELGAIAARTTARHDSAARNRLTELVRSLDTQAEKIAAPRATLFHLLLLIPLVCALYLMPHPRHDVDAMYWVGRTLELLFGLTAGLAVAFWVWTEWPARTRLPSLVWAIVLACHVAWSALRWPAAHAQANRRDELYLNAQSTVTIAAMEKLQARSRDMQEQLQLFEERAVMRGLPAADADTLHDMMAALRVNLAAQIAAERRYADDRVVIDDPDTSVARIVRARIALTDLELQHVDTVASLIDFLLRERAHWRLPTMAGNALQFDNAEVRQEFEARLEAVERSLQRDSAVRNAL
jgi:hypothetical protein